MSTRSPRFRPAALRALGLGLTLAAAAACCPGPAGAGPKDDRGAEPLKLRLRTRVQPFKGTDAWDEVVLTREVPAKEAALIVCDMWDDHWCPAARRCAELAKKMAPVLAAARDRGVLIIHAPSECMDFYKGTPQRRRAQEAPRAEPPTPLPLPDPPLPVDASDGGCDAEPPASFSKAWTRQHPAIPIAGPDAVSDSGPEVYNLLRQRGISTLLVAGVHTNMCVLNRPFAIKQMTRWGVRCVLVRDLTDSMYNPRRKPFVSHDEGTELIVRHVEKYWCPSVTSADLLPGR